RFRNSQFNPALFFVERLIRDDREPEFVGVKIQRAVLIAHRNADKFNLFDHDASNLIGLQTSRPRLITVAHQKMLSFYRYSTIFTSSFLLLLFLVPRFKGTIPIDDYVLDVLMRDLTAHDQKPAAYLVYLHLHSQAVRRYWKPIPASVRTIADATGLSKSAVHTALGHLRRRQLIATSADPPPATPRHRVLRHW